MTATTRAMTAMTTTTRAGTAMTATTRAGSAMTATTRAGTAMTTATCAGTATAAETANPRDNTARTSAHGGATRPSGGDIDMVEPFEACRRLGIAPGHLIEMIDTGQIAAFDLGGAIRLRATDVARWYARSRTAA